MNKNTSVAIIVTLAACYSAAASAGFTFTQVMRSEGQPPMEMKVWTDGGAAKIEYSNMPAGNPIMKSGSYMLMNGEEVFLVNPADRTYARFDLSRMANMAQEMSQATGAGGMVEFTNVKVEKLLDEPGETIRGYPTRHYQFKSSWTMKMANMPMTTDYEAVEDMWVTDAVQIEMGPGAAFDTSGLPQAAKELAEAQALKDVQGFPLRQVTEQTMKTNMGMGGIGGRMAQRMMNRATGGGQPMRTTTEVTDLQEVDIPAETFELPAGYSEIQLFQQN